MLVSGKDKETTCFHTRPYASAGPVVLLSAENWILIFDLKMEDVPNYFQNV